MVFAADCPSPQGPNLNIVFPGELHSDISWVSYTLCTVLRHPDLCLTAVGAKRKLGLQNQEEDVGMIGVHYEVCMRDGANMPSRTT